jgi:uncharacterized protein DUF4214
VLQANPTLSKVINNVRIKLLSFLVIMAVSLVAASSAYGQATIEILNDVDAPGFGFNDNTPVAPVGGNNGTTLGQQRLNAFQAAANIWGATLTSVPKITIRASWDSTMPCTATSGTLGSAAPVTLRQNFANAPFTGTWYPTALGNALSGVDSNTSNPEIRARFNPDVGNSDCISGHPWYLGLDNNHGTKVDLVAVLLHEFGHGLGFLTFTDPETGEFAGTAPGFPSIWDRFLRDDSTGKLWINMTSAERVASSINNGSLVWDGPQVTAGVPGFLVNGADSSNRVRMYAPNPVDPGSSVSHFDTTASPNLLMEPNISNSLTHNVGPPSDLTLPLLQDIGWNSVTASPTPTPSPPPNDNFANAQVISGCSGTVNGTNAGATRESGEPDHGPGNGGTRSIWYQWTSPFSGSMHMDTSGSSFGGSPLDTVLAVYTGTAVNSLQLVTQNDDAQANAILTSSVDFQATAGTVYYIAVGGFNNGSGGDFGSITLNWSSIVCTNGVWSPTVLSASQVDLRSWTISGRTFAYAKLTFPTAGFRVTNWGTPTSAGNAFTVDALVESFSGGSAQVITSTAQIWDLGALAVGDYTFTFKNSGTTVKTLNFTVSNTPPPTNPIDDARTFVFWQYKDFLRRDPDAPGWDHWTAEITQCTDAANRRPGETEAQCVDRKRENTSAAFFVSPEFSNIGYFVLRVYRGSLGRMPFYGGGNTANDEFTRDAATIGQGIVVNNELAPNVINANKQAFVNAFVTRTDFRAIYDGLSNTQYVDKLFQTTGVTPSASDRQALIDGLNGGSLTRATVLFNVVDGTMTGVGGGLTFNTTYGQAFYNNLFNAAFVQMEYFGYLQRDPDPDGYAFWLGKLNFFGDWVNAEMVKSFIKSPEYRARFGAP